MKVAVADEHRVLDHAVEIDAAVRFAAWLSVLAPFNHAFADYEREDLEALAEECFCGTPSE